MYFYFGVLLVVLLPLYAPFGRSSANKKDTERCPFCLVKIKKKDLNSSDGGAGLEYESRRGRIKGVRQGRKQGVSEARTAERTETTMFSSGKKKCNAFRFLILFPSPTFDFLMFLWYNN
jgi:hypothetical protein